MKKKKEIKGFFEKIIGIIKKSSEEEKRKSDERKKNKNNKPKGMRARQLGMVTFWVLFSFMFLVTVVNIFGGSGEVEVSNSELERNKLYENEGLSFAEEFTFQYFTWSAGLDGRNERMERLDPYLLDGIDQLGGTNHKEDWSSSIDKRNIVLKDIQRVNDEQARYTFKVKFTLENVNEDEKTLTEKYITIPVYYDKESDKFAVYSLPSFTYVDEGNLEIEIETKLNELSSISNGYTRDNLISFMETFFESYTKDGKDKISYILEDEKHQHGLDGTMEFAGISNADIYNADHNNNRFIIIAEVLLKDPETEFEFMNDYFLVVKRKDQRYVVESLNDETHIEQVAQEFIETTEELGTTDLTVEEETNDFDYEGINEQEEDYFEKSDEEADGLENELDEETDKNLDETDDNEDSDE